MMQIISTMMMMMVMLVMMESMFSSSGEDEEEDSLLWCIEPDPPDQLATGPWLYSGDDVLLVEYITADPVSVDWWEIIEVGTDLIYDTRFSGQGNTLHVLSPNMMYWVAAPEPICLYAVYTGG